VISGINYRGGWKIIPGQDRTHGPVTTTKLTPEELERYNRVQPNGLKKPVRLESGDKIRDRNKKEDNRYENVTNNDRATIRRMQGTWH